MEELIVGVGLIGKALSQGVIIDPHHVKCKRRGWRDHVVMCFGKDPIETLCLQVK